MKKNHEKRLERLEAQMQAAENDYSGCFDFWLLMRRDETPGADGMSYSELAEAALENERKRGHTKAETVSEWRREVINTYFRPYLWNIPQFLDKGAKR